MFFLFKHKNRQEYQEQNKKQDKITKKIVGRCWGFKFKASKFLQSKSDMISTKSKRLMIITFYFF